MTRSRFLLAFLIFIAIPIHAADKIRVPCSNPISGRYIVVLNDGAFRDKSSAPSVIASPLWAVASNLVLAHGGRVSTLLEHAPKGFTVRILDGAAKALANDPRVAYVEQVCPISPSSGQEFPPWGLDRVDQVKLPLNSLYTYNETGAGVNVYVIDTGISPHGEFGGRLRPGRNFYPGSGPTMTEDCWVSADAPRGHGTAVAGIIGGATTGVAKGVNLYPLRVFGCAQSPLGNYGHDYAVEAVNWLITNHVKPAVANLSLHFSTGGVPTALDQAVQGAINAGIITVISAGNGGGDACAITPARVTAGLTVGASTQYDQRSGVSNVGSCLDLFAPGEQIYAPAKDGGYVTDYTGTSFAAPHVSGAAALYLQGNPGASVSTVNQIILSNAAVYELSGNLGTGSPNTLLFAKPTDACFDWFCDPHTRTCTFGPGCSRAGNGLYYYAWDFGDGYSTSTAYNYIEHTFPANDLYFVTLTVVPFIGLTDATSICVNVSFLGTTCQQSGQTP